MSATVECPATEPVLCEYPEFVLAGRVDDVDHPAEVTVYPADVDGTARATTWLTVDADLPVELSVVR